MSFDWETLARIHERTDGRCHLCGADFALDDYKEVWEVDHSQPKSLGGTNHPNNLYPACVSCNRSKGNRSSQTIRSWNGLSQSPLSKKKFVQRRTQNVALCGLGVGLVGRAIHPKGFWWGTLFGVALGLIIDAE